ncbi:RNA-binding protein [Arcobacter sp. CECT 8983]|uniref:RNA recognition motif domain-containing protein n=1 Tax=Arcobacter sp. CECT 8983 TaxID=2044508 RepID=UPI00100B15A4|nr:RNA-binding protein [Arcobacter sp. CECT 8983]RXJ91666.1 RNA-binding protein [Arcobacter sp. CECT 8983]
MNIYVGNLSFRMNDSELEKVFAEFGEVKSAKVITDRETGRSKGFGFVEMADSSAGNEAIEKLNGNEVEGRTLRVNEARPREERPRRQF